MASGDGGVNHCVVYRWWVVQVVPRRGVVAGSVVLVCHDIKWSKCICGTFVSRQILTLPGVARVKDADSSLRRQAAATEEMTSEMEDEGVLFTAMTVESGMVERHLRIRPAGVDGRYSVRMMRSLSG